eukprot:jgi/Undpi1/9169/HiC_scaffold_26.g11627.m1
MVGVALSFLDGRSLTSFEAASRGTKLAVQGHPNLFKTLLTNQMTNVPQMAPLSSKEGKRALIAWDGGDFQPLQARQDRVAPSPRYLHRVALANDGWHYLFGGHRQLDVVGDVWRFRVENRQRRSTKGGFARVSVRWEHVDGGASVGDGGSDSDSDGVDDGATGSRGSATESESESESEEELDEGNPAVDGAILPPVVVGPQPLPMAPEVVAAGVPGMGVPENQELFFEGDPLPADFDANGKPTRPRPRCAASWVCVPGGNKIYLYGGHGSGNDFLDDLWCFHAGARGECRWEKLDAVGALRPRESEDQDEGREANVGRFSVPDGRWGHTMVEHRGALYMFGGSSPGHAYAGLWLLDTSVSPCVWSLLKQEGEQPPARGGHSATVVGDTLYIFGGNIITTSGWHARSPGLILGLKLPLVVVVLAVAVVGAGPMGVLAQETGEDDSGSGGTGVGKSILNYLIIIVLVAASGLFSGLTLGLLGLDKIGLEIISNGDEPRMAAFAK